MNLTGGDSMSVVLANKRVKEDKEMRNVYCETLMELSEENKKIVVT